MGRSVFPKDPYQKALCKLIEEYADEHLAKILYKFRMEINKEESQQDKALLAQYQKVVEENLTILNNLLDGREWLVGDTFTLADISIYSFLQRMAAEPKSWRIIEENYPHIKRWFEAVKAM
jgi:glutathione S-transferase